MIKLEQDKEDLQFRINQTMKEEADKIFHKLDLQEKTWQDRHNNLYELGKEIYINQSRLKENQENIKQVIKDGQERTQENLSKLMVQENQKLIENIRKETDESWQLIKMERQDMSSIQISTIQKQEERYNNLYEGLKMIFQETQERSNALEDNIESQNQNLIISRNVENIVTNNDIGLHTIEEDILMAKNIFEERIIELRFTIENENRENPTNKVVEILENGQEKVCHAIRENNENMMEQRRSIQNMEKLIVKSTGKIKEMITNNNMCNEFKEFPRELIEIQRKDLDNLESQHRTIFKKEEENTKEIWEIN
jgi:hypothetical protein